MAASRSMPVHYQRRGAIGHLRLELPRANALTQAACVQIVAHLDHAAAEVGGLLISGRPGVLSAGLDLGELLGGTAADVRALAVDLCDLLRRIYVFPLPVVVACEGHAMGGGALLLLAGDLRLGSPEGRVGVTAAKIGLPYPAAAIELVRNGLGPGAAERALLLAEILDGPARIQAGWLHRIHPAGEVVDRALAGAEALAELDSAVFRSTKARLRAPGLRRIDAAAAHDPELFVTAMARPEVRARVERSLARLRRER